MIRDPGLRPVNRVGTWAAEVRRRVAARVARFWVRIHILAFIF